jgi:hypothetical protein
MLLRYVQKQIWKVGGIGLKDDTPLNPDVLLDCFREFLLFCDDVHNLRLSLRLLNGLPSIWSIIFPSPTSKLRRYLCKRTFFPFVDVII